MEINGSVVIGDFCVVKVKSLLMNNKSEIRSFNYIKGSFDVVMGEKASIAKFNKFVNDSRSYCIRPSLILGTNTHIVANHFFDLTNSIKIGDNSLIAGRGTAMWTHHFILATEGDGRVCIYGDINIGHNVYIGSGCIICDNVVIGAGTVVARKITQKGIYVSQPLRRLDLSSIEVDCINDIRK